MAEEKKNARRAARETVFALLYETEFHAGESAEAIYALAVENREIDPENAYIHDVYFGVMANIEAVDAMIGRHAKGWKTNRLSRAVLRLGAYEMAYVDDVPAPVAINEAVELSKKFDDPKARAFINGVLNAIKNELAEGGKNEENE